MSEVIHFDFTFLNDVVGLLELCEWAKQYPRIRYSLYIDISLDEETLRHRLAIPRDMHEEIIYLRFRWGEKWT